MAVSLKLIWCKNRIRSNRIFSVYSGIKTEWTLYYSGLLITRVRARLVRRLIWVEDKLCSNHNDPMTC